MSAGQQDAAAVDDRQAFTVRLRRDIHRALRMESLDGGTSAQDIIAAMLAARYHLPPVVPDKGQAPPASRDLSTGG